MKMKPEHYEKMETKARARKRKIRDESQSWSFIVILNERLLRSEGLRQAARCAAFFAAHKKRAISPLPHSNYTDAKKCGFGQPPKPHRVREFSALRFCRVAVERQFLRIASSSTLLSERV
jgi:hypothetical protein